MCNCCNVVLNNNHQNSKVVYRRAKTPSTKWRQMNNWKILNSKIISQRIHKLKSTFEMFIQWSSPGVTQSLAKFIYKKKICSWLEGRNKWETNGTFTRAPSDVEKNSVSVVFPVIVVIYYLSHVTHFVEQSLWNVFKQWILGKLMQQLSWYNCC